MSEKLIIDILGHQGDGIAQINGGRVFIPFALAGEKVCVAGASNKRELIEVITPSPDRIQPICQHFGTCGGCQLQHFSAPPYQQWKRNLVVEALSSLDDDVHVEPLVVLPGKGRRRAVFSATHSHDGVHFGFSGKASHSIIHLEHCPVLADEISTKLQLIKKIIRPLLPAKGITSICVLSSASGLDIQVDGKKIPGSKQRQAAIRVALEAGISRLSYGDEPLIEARRPQLICGDSVVYPPPGTFVQADARAQSAMVELVSAHFTGCKTLADLFCGVGTFALPLCEFATVLACESDEPALGALEEAWRASGGKLKAMQTQMRDLFIRPLMADEMKKIHGVVFDPPRAGAEAQAAQLARSKVRKIAAVSCNPTTLARDLAILIKGGYKLEKVVPIDQFVYTPHVEVVALLSR